MCLLSVFLCVIEYKCMCVPVSEHVYRGVYMSVRIRVIFMDFVLKITKICEQFLLYCIV